MTDAPAGPDRPALRSTLIARLTRRSEFLSVAHGTRVHRPLFTIQAAKRPPVPIQTPDEARARVGLTVTKKEGGAVERNRIRRRLREALRHAKALSTDDDTDYVIVARRAAITVPFGRLVADLEAAVRRAGFQLRNPRGPKPERKARPSGS